jgi:hypothetical protein
VNASNAKRNQGIGLDILKKTLSELNHIPSRKLPTVREFNQYFNDEKE